MSLKELKLKHHIQIKDVTSQLAIKEEQFLDWAVANFDTYLHQNIFINRVESEAKYHPEYKSYPKSPIISQKRLTIIEQEIIDEQNNLLPISKAQLQDGLRSSGYRMFLPELQKAHLASKEEDDFFYCDYADPLISCSVFDLFLPVHVAKKIAQKLNNIQLHITVNSKPNTPHLSMGEEKFSITKTQALIIWGLLSLREKEDKYYTSSEIKQEATLIQDENNLNMVQALNNNSSTQLDSFGKIFSTIEQHISSSEIFDGKTWIVKIDSNNPKDIRYKLILPICVVKN